ncbi:TPA: hypothetical protein ACP2P7_004525, partial [Escherichia coli]
YVQQLKHRPPFAGSLPPEPHAELFHLVVAGLRSVRQAQVLVFLLDRVVSDRVHPGNGIHELPPSLILAWRGQASRDARTVTLVRAQLQHQGRPQ